MFETIYNASKYLGEFNMDKIFSGTIELFIQGYECPLQMISFTFNPRRGDNSENTDFRSWNADDWWRNIREYYESHRLDAEDAKIVTVGLYYFLSDDYREDMSELEWTNVYSTAGFNRIIIAPFREGPVGDVYLEREESELLRSIDDAEKLRHKVFSDRKRVRYGSEEGISSLPLVLQKYVDASLVRKHCDHIY